MRDGAPIYLHFLDRELAESVRFAQSPELTARIMRLAALATVSPLYCSYSHLRRDAGFHQGLAVIGEAIAVNLCDVLLIVSNDIEEEELLRSWRKKSGNGVERITFGAKTYTFLGDVGGARVVSVRSEAGSSWLGASASTIAESMNLWRPSYVVLLGICFGTNRNEQRIGDVIVSTGVSLYEKSRIGTVWGFVPRWRLRGERRDSSRILVDRFRASARTWVSGRTHFGLMLSGEKLIDNPLVRMALVRGEPDAVGGEMEGMGVVLATAESKVQWIIVKGIADWADGKKKRSEQENQTLAARNAVGLVMHTLETDGFRLYAGKLWESELYILG